MARTPGSLSDWVEFNGYAGGIWRIRAHSGLIRFRLTVSRLTLHVPVLPPRPRAPALTLILESDLMRSTTRTAVVLALGCLAGGAADANAAWNNVFQTTACCGESTR